MANRVVWSGLDEFRADLRQLPTAAATEAAEIVLSEAQAAHGEILAAYPSRSGNLKRGMRVRQMPAGRFAARAIVENRAPHAVIFENGTQARHTELGANRGAMPPGHVFVPPIQRHRRAMYERLKAVLVGLGLKVTGDAG